MAKSKDPNVATLADKKRKSGEQQRSFNWRSPLTGNLLIMDKAEAYVEMMTKLVQEARYNRMISKLSRDIWCLTDDENKIFGAGFGPFVNYPKPRDK